MKKTDKKLTKTLKVIEDDGYNKLYAVDSIPLSKQAIEDLKDIFSPWLNNKKDNIKKDEEKHMKVSVNSSTPSLSSKVCKFLDFFSAVSDDRHFASNNTLTKW